MRTQHESAGPVIRWKSLDNPDEHRSITHGTGVYVAIDSLAIGRAVLEPGWRWSVDVKDLAGTELCEFHHVHVLLSGRMGFRMESGQAHEFSPNDVMDIPPGHDAWVIGDERAILLDISGNIADFGLATPRARAVATMLMTDIVGSTSIASKIGDAAWKQRLAEHNRVVRHELDRFQGREVKTTGDGFLAIFASAASALRCALAAENATREIGIEIRAGVHTGEVEILSDDVRGIAVHATSRIMAAARGSEVLTSAVSRALAEGAGLHFDDRGPHALKGFETPVQLFAVVRRAAARRP